MIPKVYTDKRYGLNKEQISNNALSIISKLQKNGYKAFLVGGCIRDSIKGENPKDFDIVTNCEPEEIRGIFRNSRIIGKRFKLVHITFANEIVETTTFRSGRDASSESIEIDEDGKIVRDNQWGTQEEDAFRRDFTINALYYDPYSNEISDYTTGLKDLKEKKIKFIGDPETRIQEDPIRILRAIRFASKLKFEIDRKAHNPIKSSVRKLKHMPPARLYEEILKLFLSGHASESYRNLKAFGIMEVLFPFHGVNIDEYHEFLVKAFFDTDNRIKNNKPLNPGFLFATLMWPRVAHDSGLKERLDFQKFYRVVATTIKEQQQICAIPRRFISFIKDIWMNQVRFKNFGKKSIGFTQSLRFRAAYDFFLIRGAIEPELKTHINWWTEFRASNYDKKNRLLKEKRKEMRKN
tara:strand:+ start:1247 stop:2470 length:1224 start_codon:yes stop_codon:yes gene_type:complete